MNTTRTSWLVAAMLVGLLPARAQSPQAQSPQEPAPAPAETEQQVKKEVAEAVEAIRDYSVARQREAVAHAQRAAERLDGEIATLQARIDRRWKEMNEHSRAGARAALADLQQRRTRLAEWLGGMRHSSAAAWGSVKSGFLDSYHELEEALRKATSEFERQQPLPPQDTPEPEPDTTERTSTDPTHDGTPV